MFMNYKDLFSKLISFKTVSKTSNQNLVNFIKNYLSEFSIQTQSIEGAKGQFNLYARIGPNQKGGILYSGHTDVVPTEGQNWNTDPFKLIKKKKRYYGRGTCDMKGFIATILYLIPKIKINKLQKPIHLIFSYDEEIGCVGIQKMIPFLKKLQPKPSFCIVGEPTEMKLVNQHKGKKNFIVEFKGIEAHSSLINNGVNAINFCSEFIEYLKSLQSSFKKEYKNERYNPPYPTINIGTINGGIALNIIPKNCNIEFEIRDTPNLDTKRIVFKIKEFLKSIEKKMKLKNNKCYVKIKESNNFPPLNTKENEKIVSMALKELETNSINTVSFGTEAGVFDKLGFQTIVCGPGSIKQAHKPNEFIDEQQILKCQKFLEKTFNYLY